MSTSPALGPYERLVLLKAISLSGPTPVPALGALASQAVERHFRAGALLVERDRAWDQVHVVVEGKVLVSDDGRPAYSADPGQVLGMIETLARVEGTVEARAAGDTVTLEIGASVLLSILEDHHAMVRNTIQALARLLLADPESCREPDPTYRLLQLPDVPAAPLDLIDRVRMLCTSTVFARARVDSLAEIAGELEEFHADPGTPFWHEHDPAAWGFVVLEGMVNSAAENGFRLAWTPGTSPGLFEALGATPRWHDAVAAEPVRGLRLNAERLFDAFEDDFAMAADVLSVMAARVCLHRRMSCNP